MPPFPLDLGTGSSPGRDGQESRTRHINCFVEALGTEAKSQKVIYPIPGLTRWDASSYTGVCRGMIERAANEFVAFLGQTVVKFDTSANATTLGSLSGTNRLFLARNQASPVQVGIVDGDGLYYILSGSTVTQITDPDLPAPNSIDYLDGYFIFGIDDGRFFISSLEDGTAIAALDYSTAESKADNLRRVKAHKGYLYLMGTESLEIWQDTGNAAFPFEPLQQDIAVGCLAAHSVAEFDNSLVWVDHKKRVVIARDGTPQRLSIHSVERAIEGLTSSQQTAIWAYTYWFEGHEIYSLNSASWTWEYDASSQRWHEVKSYGLDYRRVSAHIHFNNKHLVGDYLAGKIYEIDPDADDEDGNPIVMEVWTPPLHQFPNGVRIDALELDLITGTGTNTTVTSELEPLVMLRWSKDGGKTFPIERQARVGRQGEYLNRARWSKLGSVREKGRIFSFSMSASVRRGFIGAAIEGAELRV